MDEVLGELLFQIVAWFGAPILTFVCRVVLWLVVGGFGVACWLIVNGVRNWLCFYRDLWLRLRWHGRRRASRPRLR